MDQAIPWARARGGAFCVPSLAALCPMLPPAVALRALAPPLPAANRTLGKVGRDDVAHTDIVSYQRRVTVAMLARGEVEALAASRRDEAAQPALAPDEAAAEDARVDVGPRAAALHACAERFLVETSEVGRVVCFASRDGGHARPGRSFGW